MSLTPELPDLKRAIARDTDPSAKLQAVVRTLAIVLH